MVTITGSVRRALADNTIGQCFVNCPIVCLHGCFAACIGGPEGPLVDCCFFCAEGGTAVGVTSNPVSAGGVAQYVTAGPLTLDASIWDESTGGSGGLVPAQSYYLSQTEPGRLTPWVPASGTATKIGTAINSTTLNVQIESGQTDGRTLVKRAPGTGPYSVVAYGSASGQDLKGRSNASWQLALTATLPGTPVYKNLVGGTDLAGLESASADTWLSSHVLGLTPTTPPTAPPPTGPIKSESFIAGGLFEMTEAQWDAVWTSADPNRGSGSGLLPGYPYYLSDVPGTFFLIDTTGTPPVASGNWITKCFVALSSTYALIQIGDPRQITSPSPGSAEFPVLFPVFVGTDFVAVPGFVNQMDGGADDRTASLPAAASVPNGTFVGIKKSNRADVTPVNLSTVLASDTIDGAPGQGGGFLDAFLSGTAASVVLVSDGISNWTILAGGNDNGF